MFSIHASMPVEWSVQLNGKRMNFIQRHRHQNTKSLSDVWNLFCGLLSILQGRYLLGGSVSHNGKSVSGRESSAFNEEEEDEQEDETIDSDE